MSAKNVIYWFHKCIHNYNLFIPDVHDEYEDVEEEPLYPARFLKQQKYATWLYVFLLISK